MSYIIIMVFFAIAAVCLFILAYRGESALRTAILAGIIFLISSGSYTIYRSMMQVDPGEGGVLIWFGTVQKTTVPPGLHMVNPMAVREFLSTRRHTIDFTDDSNEGNDVNPINGPAVLVTTKDHNQLRVNVSIPYSLNPPYLSYLYSVVGKTNSEIETKLLETHARSTLIAVSSEFKWQPLLADSHEKVLKEIHTRMKDAIKKDLVVYGVPEKIADKAIIISPPQIRQIVPSDKVKGAIDEAAATTVLLDRQQDLIAIAEAKVQQREKEGSAINAMFDKLPEGVTAQDIHAVLSAMAKKENADAVMKAVEKGGVSMIIMNNGGGTATPAMQVK